MTLREIYKRLKKGTIELCNDSWCDYIEIDDEYIRWSHYGHSAETISFENFVWLVHTIFKCKNANELLEHFNINA